MSTFINEHDMFIFTLYYNNLQIGKNNDDYHNAVKDEFVESLTDLIIPSHYNGKKVIRVGYRAFSCLPNLLSAFVPNSIIEIRGDMFLKSEKLNTITFEDNSKVENLELYTFFETNISQITIPSSVKTLNRRNFYNCKHLHTVIFLGIAYSDYNDVFEECNEDLRILVPLNYPNDSFGGRIVIKTMPYFASFKKTSCSHRAINFVIYFHILTNIFIVLE